MKLVALGTAAIGNSANPEKNHPMLCQTKIGDRFDPWLAPRKHRHHTPSDSGEAEPLIRDRHRLALNRHWNCGQNRYPKTRLLAHD